jgi:predicted O-methyltransferase YrrM
MKTDYTQIEGWFSATDALFYEMIALSLPNNAKILEIGAYKGRSTVCMDTYCKDLGKNVQIDIIDTFEGDMHMGIKPSYIDEFIHNTQNCNIGKVIPENSRVAHELIGDTRYDFIFIDAGHAKEDVMADITNYRPFLTDSGLLGGHDLMYFGIADALKSLKITYKAYGNCWLMT